MTCEFSLSHYVETLQEYLKAGYEFYQVRDAPNFEFDMAKRAIILRHDIDLSLDFAVQFAAFEHVHGIQSTYFILLYSPLYNIFSPDGVKAIKKIVELGHEIGLQVDTRFTHSIDRDMKILEDLSGSYVNSYAQHFVTTTPPITRQMESMERYGVNAMKFTHMNGTDVHYISDSGMNWREECFCRHKMEYDKMQILIHPEWWICSGNRYNIIDECTENEIRRVRRETSEWKSILERYLAEMNPSQIHA